MIDYGQYNSINQNYTWVKSAKRDLITARMWNSGRCILCDLAYLTDSDVHILQHKST